MSLPQLSIAALGGTVSMQATHPDQGVVPSVNGQALLAQVPLLATRARIHVETLCLQPSASLDFDFLLGVLDWARRQVEQGASGVVITQGSDTLEESAFLFELLWDREGPLVLTGAMRSAAEISADGPANLLHAGLVALASASRGRGVQVVINGQVHGASRVRKSDALALEAFSSPVFGPNGLIIENAVRYCARPHPAKNLAVTVAHRTTDRPARSVTIGRYVDPGEAAGAGLRRPGDCRLRRGPRQRKLGRGAHAIGAENAGADRHATGAGSTANHSYGFVGSEIYAPGQGRRWRVFCARARRGFCCGSMSSAASRPLALPDYHQTLRR